MTAISEAPLAATDGRLRREPFEGLREQDSEVSIVLVDDHAIVRGALATLLNSEPDLSVVAAAGDVESGLRYVLGHKPDIVILDLNLPDSSGLDAIPLVGERSPRTKVVILTMQDETSLARDAMQAGAGAFVLKEAAGEELVGAVRTVVAGGRYLHPSVGARIAEQALAPPDGLSNTEVDVLASIALGHTHPEIAEQLVVSVRTVEHHREHIQDKLGLSNRSELVRYAIDHELLRPRLRALRK